MNHPGRFAIPVAWLIGTLLVLAGCKPTPEPDPEDPPEDKPVTCSWVTPTDHSIAAGELLLAVRCSHPSGMGRVEYYRSSTYLGQVAAAQADGSYPFRFDTSSVVDGNHRFSILAYAVDGSRGNHAITVTTDNTLPVLQLLEPSGESSVRLVGQLLVKLQVWDPVARGGSRQPVVRVQVQLDDGTLQVGAEAPDPDQPLTLTLDIAGVTTGDHELVLEATDRAGNRSRTVLPVYIVTAPRFRSVELQQIGIESQYPTDLAVGDANGDGYPDLWFSYANQIVVRAGAGDGTFGPPEVILPMPAGASRILVTDLAGDGRPVLIRALRGPGGPVVAIHPRTEAGWRTDPELHTVSEVPTVLRVAQLTPDRWPELLLGGEYDASALTVLVGRDPAGGQPFFEDGLRLAPGVNGVRSIQVADFNQDGKPDVVVGRDGTPVFSVFPGQGDGTFGMPRNTGEADGCLSYALGVAVGDFLEDGVPDVAVTQQSGGVLVYRSTGQAEDWQFSIEDQVFQSTTARGSREILTTDLDGDRHADLLIVNVEAKNLAIFAGLGDGRFQERELFNLGPNPDRLQLADLNQDGRPELVYLIRGTDRFVVVLGRPGGGFAAAPELRLPPEEQPVDLVLGTFGGADRPSLAVVGQLNSAGGRYWTNVYLARNDSGYPRSPFTVTEVEIEGRPVDARVGNLDGDEYQDLVLATDVNCVAPGPCDPNLHLLLGGEEGFQRQVALQSGSRLSTLALCDLDGDAVDDLLVGQPTIGEGPPVLRFNLLEVTGSGPAIRDSGWTRLSGDPVDLQCARLNVDADFDYLSVNAGDNALNYFKGRQQVLPPIQGERQVLGVGSYPRRLAVADVDGDGQRDALVSVESNLAIAFGALSGETFDTSTYLPPSAIDAFTGGRDPWGVAVHDFTEDQLPDLATVNRANGSISVYLNAGRRQFFGPVSFHTSNYPTELVSGDLNGDGCADLAVLNRQGLTVTLLLAEGSSCGATQ